MLHEITKKNVPPVMALTNLEKCTFPQIFDTIREFPLTVLLNEKESFYCVGDGYPPNQETKYQVYTPVTDKKTQKDYKNHKLTILQRVDVVSVVLGVDYENKDLSDIFEAMDLYITENNLKAKESYRIIYHQEKRKWQRNAFLKRTKKGIITEIQIVLE